MTEPLKPCEICGSTDAPFENKEGDRLCAEHSALLMFTLAHPIESLTQLVQQARAPQSPAPLAEGGVKRWYLQGGQYDAEMLEGNEVYPGDYVLYTDYAALQAENARLKAEMDNSKGAWIAENFRDVVTVEINALRAQLAACQSDLEAALQAQASAEARLKEATQWRPIESAPKDGKIVLLYWPHWCSKAISGWFLWDRWNAREALSQQDDPGPQGWLPLPTPPKEA